MRTHSVKVAGRTISYPFNDRAIAKNVGADQLSVEFDDEWKATTSALAVFAGSGTVVRVAISAASGKATVAIPWECLQEGGKLHVSFVGYLAGNARIVTEKMSRPFLVAGRCAGRAGRRRQGRKRGERRGGKREQRGKVRQRRRQQCKLRGRQPVRPEGVLRVGGKSGK